MKNYLLCIALIVSGFAHAELDPLYSQYMFNQLSLNPAYAGSRDVMSIYALARNQWTGNGAPNTQVLSVHSPLMNRKIALGLQIVEDQLGPVKNSGAYAAYAYRIRMKNARLAFGVRLGMNTYKFDQSLVTYKDPSENDVSVFRETHLTGDFGIYYNSRSWYWGWSLLHLMDKNFQRNLMVGRAFRASQNLIINPSFLFKSAGNTHNLDINVNFLVRQKFWLGISLRHTKALPILFQYMVSDRFKIGLSYDIPAGQLMGYLGHSTEILLQWDLNVRKTKTLSPRYL